MKYLAKGDFFRNTADLLVSPNLKSLDTVNSALNIEKHYMIWDYERELKIVSTERHIPAVLGSNLSLLCRAGEQNLTGAKSTFEHIFIRNLLTSPTLLYGSCTGKEGWNFQRLIARRSTWDSYVTSVDTYNTYHACLWKEHSITSPLFNQL